LFSVATFVAEHLGLGRRVYPGRTAVDIAGTASGPRRGTRAAPRLVAQYAALAVPFGVVYGYLSLEALSGLAPALLLEIVGMGFLARRIPGGAWAVTAATVGFCSGFAGTWLALLTGRPYCCGVAEDAAWAAGLVLIAVVPFVRCLAEHRVWEECGQGHERAATRQAPG
jgi:hypothetical protein